MDATPYLQYILHGGGLDVSVVSRDGRDDAYYVFDGEPEAATAGGLRAEEEDADRWRGVVLVEVVEARPGPAVSRGPHDFTAGSFHCFGDAELLRRVRKALGFGPEEPAPHDNGGSHPDNRPKEARAFTGDP